MRTSILSMLRTSRFDPPGSRSVSGRIEKVWIQIKVAARPTAAR